jgi:hypothetical protein
VCRRVAWVGLEVGDPQQAGIAMHERAWDHAGDGIAGQARAHAETVELAQRSQRGRGHQGAMGDTPEAAT